MKLEQLKQSSWQKSSGMNLSDISMLLGYVGIYDLRVQVDELKVRAWSESLDSDLTLEEAKKIVSFHYANSDQAVNPSHINKQWRVRVASAKERERSERIAQEMREAEQKAAPPEVAQKYLDEIREILNRGKNASLETNHGEVAPDL
jgi:DNA-binding transcriptional MerR regulator